MRGFAHRLTLLVLAISLSGVVPASAATRLTGISFSGESNGIIVGTNSTGPGYVSYTTDGGQTYQPTLFPPDRWLVAGDIAGTKAVAIQSMWNRVLATPSVPSAWATSTPVPAFRGVDIDLNAVASLAGGTIAVVGQDRETTRGNLAIIATSNDDGLTWANRFTGPYYARVIDPVTGEVISEAPRTRSDLVAIDSDVSGLNAWTVGSETQESDGIYVFRGPMIKKTADGGSSWTTQTPTAGVTTGLQAVSASSGQVAFAAGSNRLFLRTTNGGTTWTRADVEIDSVSRTDKYINVLAMDSLGTSAVVAGVAGKIAWTTDATAAVPDWTFLNLANKATLRGVAMIDADSWMVVGDDETVARTDTAGATWSVTSASPPAVSVTGPANGFPLGSDLITFSGTASDAGAGVTGVGVRIRRADGQSFNGVGWQTGEFWLPAQSDDGFKTWSLVWGDVPSALADGQMVSVTAKATDAIGLSTVGNTISSGIALTGSVLVGSGATYTNLSTVPVALSAPGASYMRYRVNGAAWPAEWSAYATSSSVSLPGGDGLKTVEFQFSQDGVNAAATASDVITLHTSVPAVSISTPTDGFSVLSGPVNVSGTASDVGGTVAGVSVRIRAADGRSWNGSGWVAADTWLPASSANQYADWSYVWTPPALMQAVSISARATDHTGLVGAAPLAITSESPAGPSITLDAGAAVTTDTVVSATISALGASHMRWAVGAAPTGSFVTLSSPVNVSLPAGDGTKTVYFDFSTDGVTSSASASDTIRLHTSVPSLSVASPIQGFSVTSAPVQVSGTASDVGGTVASVELRIRRADGRSWNGSAWTADESWLAATSANDYANWTSSWTPDEEFLGANQLVSVAVRATDDAGVVSSLVERTSIAPVVAQISVAGGAPFSASSLVDVNVSQSGAEYLQWRVGAGDWSGWQPVASTVPVTLSDGDGVKTVEFRFSVDGLTVAASASDTIVRDSTAPLMSIQAPAASFALDAGNVSISGTASDATSGILKAQVRISQGGRYWSGSPLSGWTADEQWLDATYVNGTWDYQWVPDAAARLNGNPATVDVRLVDAAGNAQILSRTSASTVTGTDMSFRAAASTVGYGLSGSLTGTLTAGGEPVAGAKVIIRSGSSVSGLKDSSLYATTNANGVFSVAVKPASKTYYAARFAATSTRGASVSAAVSVTPRAYLSTPSGPTSVRRATRFTASGYLKPRHTSGSSAVRIYLYKRASNGTYKYYRYYYAKASNYSNYSKYTASIALPTAGKWRIRAYHGDSGHAASYSPYRYVTAK